MAPLLLLLLPARRNRAVSRVLLLHVLLLVTQGVAFSWHGAYNSGPSPSSSSSSSSPSSSSRRSGSSDGDGAHSSSSSSSSSSSFGWQPEEESPFSSSSSSLWWRNRRRNLPFPDPASAAVKPEEESVGVWFVPKGRRPHPHHHYHHRHHQPSSAAVAAAAAAASSPQRDAEGFLELQLDNRITNMGQPAFAAPHLEEKAEDVGMGLKGFLRPVHPHPHPHHHQQEAAGARSPHYVSLHPSSSSSSSSSSIPSLFSPLGAMNRRNKLNRVKEELDKEVVKNVISQMLHEDQHHQHGLRSQDPALVQEGAAPTTAPSPPSSAQREGEERGHGSRFLVPVPVPAGAMDLAPLPRHSARSSSSPDASFSSFSSSSSSSPSQAFSSGFGDPFSQDSFSDFSSSSSFSSPSLGFGSFVDPSDLPGGFGGGPGSLGQEALPQQQPQKSQGFGFQDHFGGGSVGGAPSGLGFGGFGKEDVSVGGFGWREPKGVGVQEGGVLEQGGIEPIPTVVAASAAASAAAVPLGSFSQDDKDCDTILTKSCADNTDCVCYGFYFCGQGGKCQDLTSSSSDTAAMTFGEKWHDGPAETLGLTGRR
ncbi:uncharacterized protein LOC143299628 [Babylonia areolata]|uniref:uncharacterized protein LOC143299628 n=1 Tax=Babylonia areolata TaxID=304850 RepID=UPI003FD61104